MPVASFRNYSGSAATLYEEFFVPAVAVPVSGELLRTAALQPGERVVDVACGTGAITRAAAERVGPTGTAIGVDLAPDMIEVATSVPAAGAPIEWHVADAAALPLPDASCDVGLCQLGLMFMADPVGALADLRRVLVPGGRVVINAPGAIQPTFEALERAIVEHLDPNLGMFVTAVFSMHDPERLATLLRDAGFADVTSATYTAPVDLPAPAEALWGYVNATPMGAFIADAPQASKDALERAVVEAWAPHVVDGRTPIDQPVALASGRRP